MALAPSFLFAVALALGNDPGVAPGVTPLSDTDHPAVTVPGPSETPASRLAVGDPAPDFAYKSYDGQWRRLADLRAQGPILIVFAPDTHALKTLQLERDRLLDLGVIPVAVCDLGAKAAFGVVRDLRLGFSLLSDPQHVIASQFNAVESRTASVAAAWFVVDAHGRVRAVGHDTFPAAGFAPLASRALGIPLGTQSRPAASH